jgi:PII-like signaling protein
MRKKWEKDHATLPFQMQLTTPVVVVVADQERPLKVTINQNPANPAQRPITEAEIQRVEVVDQGVVEVASIQAIQIQKS